jgi:hypothetical protein
VSIGIPLSLLHLPCARTEPLARDGARGCGAAAAVESTHRLFLLLSAVQPLPVAVVEYSSHQTQNERSAALRAFKAATAAGRGIVLVASDAMTRGMDIKVRFGSPELTPLEREKRQRQQRDDVVSCMSGAGWLLGWCCLGGQRRA